MSPSARFVAIGIVVLFLGVVAASCVKPSLGPSVAAIAFPLGVNDPLAAQQWALSHVNATNAWQTTFGSPSIIVAILDTGLDSTHPDLQGARFLTGYNAFTGGSDVTDDCGHGTPTTGMVAATTNNGIGIAGLAQISILPIKVMKVQPTGECNGPFSLVAAGIRYAVDHHANVIDLELGCNGCFDAGTSDALQYALSNDALVVAPVGNDGPCVNCAAWPGSDLRVISVGCTDSKRVPCYFSSTGPSLELMAPGKSVLTTLKGGSYGLFSGTSASAAQVAGTAALLWSAATNMTAQEVRARLDATALDITPAGRDNQSGYGLVDVGRALAGFLPSGPGLAPRAAFSVAASGLTVSVDASASTDPDGYVRVFSWAWGDGGIGEGPVTAHQYDQPGTYTIDLFAVDNSGRSAAASAVVTVSAAPPPYVNKAPVASFTASVTDLTASVDGSGSFDPDGSIVDYAWAWGDGATSVGPTARHAYAAAGSYVVELRVTDNASAAGVTSKAIATTAPPDQPPVASFTFAVSASNPLRVDTNASSSSDPDGTLVAFAWDWGDGATSAGVTATHTFAASGNYAVTLSVTDNDGSKGSRSATVAVKAAKNVAPVASFTVTASALTASVNAAASYDPDGSIASYRWTWGDGSTTTGAVTSHAYAAAGAFTITLTVMDNLGLTTSTSQTFTATPPYVDQPPVPSLVLTDGNLTVSADGHASSDPDGSVYAWRWDWGDGTFSVGPFANHTFPTPGARTVKLTVTDNASLSATVSGVVQVTSPLVPQPPLPAFTVTQQGLSVKADGTTSYDPDGIVVSYTWAWGDGTSASGIVASHTYDAVGTFTVTLNATDFTGLWATITRVVTVTAPITGNALHVGSLTHTTLVNANTVQVNWDVVVYDKVNAPVRDVTVNVTIAFVTSTLPYNTTTVPGGRAEFTLATTLRGPYTLCVTALARAGYAYDAASNVVACDTYGP